MGGLFGFFYKMIQSTLEGVDYELSGVYGGKYSRPFGENWKNVFFCGEVGTGGAENFPTCREPRIKMYTFVRLDLEG